MSRSEAQKALAAGDVVACRAALIDAIRSAPGDAALRSFLFQLSCITGDWERATKQLGVLADLKPDAIDMVGDYRTAIAAEATRTAVFAGAQAPMLFGEPRAWATDLADALRHDAAGETALAASLRTRALEAAPAEPGSVNGQRFDWIADADTRLGPVLEVVMNGAYRWIAMEDVAKLEVTPPSELHDVVWSVGMLTITGGGDWPVMIPTRYPGTEQAADPALLLARRTEWDEISEGHFAGSGQRLLAHAEGDVALFDLRTLEFDRPEPEAPAEDDTES